MNEGIPNTGCLHSSLSLSFLEEVERTHQVDQTEAQYH